MNEVKNKVGQVVGWQQEIGRATVFFGNRNIDLDGLRQTLPQYRFAVLNQVHGNACVPADALVQQTADAHWTEQTQLALTIKTADCLPVLVITPEKICAIHAGWRGVAKNIVGTALTTLADVDCHIFIGPHIGVQSFAIGLDVCQQLLHNTSSADAARLVHPHTDPQKCHFDLKGRVLMQITQQAPKAQVHHWSLDTLTDPQFFSFRRDAVAGQRQYSFVVLKN